MHLYYAFLVSLFLLYTACFPLYPFFRVPLHRNLVGFSLVLVLSTALITFPLVFFLRKRLFPVETLHDPYWSYTATRRYFWLYVLCLVPFGLALLIFIFFAPLSVLTAGFIVSLCGLILVRPKEEDLR